VAVAEMIKRIRTASCPRLVTRILSDLMEGTARILERFPADSPDHVGSRSPTLPSPFSRNKIAAAGSLVLIFCRLRQYPTDGMGLS
jgi:hypothetical protein